MQIIQKDPFPKRTILYYPTIDVPPSSWLRQALLYWDEVSSIVPKDYENNPLIKFSPEVEFLISEKEFAPIHPEELVFNEINHHAYREFETEFLEIVGSDDYKKFLAKNYYGASKGNVEQRYWSEIHSNKTSNTIYYTLEEKQLARPSSKQSWYEFETNTALLYMSLLAKHLAGIQKNPTIIGTGFSIYESLNFKAPSKSEGELVTNLSLNNLLPVPIDNVPFEAILDFKRKRKANLVRFRKILLNYDKQLSSAESPENIRDIVADFKEELTLGIADLQNALKSSKITSSLRTIKSLLAFSKYPIVVAAGTYAEQKLKLPTGSLSISTTAITGLIEFGCNYIEKRSERGGIVQESAFSYVYDAQQAGLIKPF